MKKEKQKLNNEDINILTNLILVECERLNKIYNKNILTEKLVTILNKIA